MNECGAASSSGRRTRLVAWGLVQNLGYEVDVVNNVAEATDALMNGSGA